MRSSTGSMKAGQHARPGVRRRARAAAAGVSMYSLRVQTIWEFLLRQPASYWLICAYLFFEYVRPQQIYEAISGWPLAFLAIILCTAVFFAEGNRVRSWTLADTALALFSGVILLSSVFAYRPEESFSNLELYLSWVLIYFLISGIVKTEGRFLVFMLSFLLYSLKMSQHAARSWGEIGFGFRDWGATGAPGWFHNSGEFAIQMTIFLPLSIYFILALRRYWPRWKLYLISLFPITAVIGLLASSSRGGQIAMGAVVIWMVARSRKKIAGLGALAALALVVFLLLPSEQKERFRSIGEDKESVARLTYWRHAGEMISEYPVLGVGYANWLPYYRANYDPRGELVHNVFLQAATELGTVGLAAFLFLILATFMLNGRTRRLSKGLGQRGIFLHHMALGLDAALVGYLVSGFFVTVLYYPYFWINLAMTVALYTSTVAERRRTGSGRFVHPRRRSRQACQVARGTG